MADSVLLQHLERVPDHHHAHYLSTFVHIFISILSTGHRKLVHLNDIGKCHGFYIYLPGIVEKSFILFIYMFCRHREMSAIHLYLYCIHVDATKISPKVSGEESLLQDRAVGARMIQASTHVCPIGGGAVKLFPSALTWSLTRSMAISCLGERLCTLPY
jgi:hypothetical protein